MRLPEARENPRNYIERLDPKDARKIVGLLVKMRRQGVTPATSFVVRRYVGDGNKAWDPNGVDRSDVQQNLEFYLAIDETGLKVRELVLVRKAIRGRYDLIEARVTCA